MTKKTAAKKPAHNTQKPIAEPAMASGLCTMIDALCEAQDAATTQILTIARLARFALDGDMDDAADNAGHALDAIIDIAASATARLDLALIEIGDARLHAAA